MPSNDGTILRASAERRSRRTNRNGTAIRVRAPAVTIKVFISSMPLLPPTRIAPIERGAPPIRFDDVHPFRLKNVTWCLPLGQSESASVRDAELRLAGSVLVTKMRHLSAQSQALAPRENGDRPRALMRLSRKISVMGATAKTCLGHKRRYGRLWPFVSERKAGTGKSRSPPLTGVLIDRLFPERRGSRHSARAEGLRVHAPGGVCVQTRSHPWPW